MSTTTSDTGLCLHFALLAGCSCHPINTSLPCTQGNLPCASASAQMLNTRILSALAAGISLTQASMNSAVQWPFLWIPIHTAQHILARIDQLHLSFLWPQFLWCMRALKTGCKILPNVSSLSYYLFICPAEQSSYLLFSTQPCSSKCVLQAQLHKHTAC